MFTSPIIFYSFFAIITSAIASLILFFRIQRNHILTTKSFFWHYAFGFIALSLTNLPIFFINLGVKLSYNSLIFFYCLCFFAVLFSYALFYRGTVLLSSKDKLLTTLFPLISLSLFAAMVVISFFVLKAKLVIMYTAVVWGFLLPLDGFLGVLFLYFFFKGAHFDSLKKQFHTIFLSLGWFLLLFVDILLWWQSVNFPYPEFWILKIASVTWWFLLRAAAYILILVGSLFYARRLQHPKIEEKT